MPLLKTIVLRLEGPVSAVKICSLNFILLNLQENYQKYSVVK